MGKRSFRELTSGSTCAFEAVAPPSTTFETRTVPMPSTAPALALITTSMPSTTSAPSTSSAAKKSARMPPSVVLHARKKAKGKAHETATSDHRRNEPRGDDESEPKRTRTDPSSPFVRVSQLVFDDDAAAMRLVATMVFPDDPYTRVYASSAGTMSRAGLKFLAFVNCVSHELEAEIEKQKRRAADYATGELAAKTECNKYAEQLDKWNKENERALGDNKRLRMENEKLAKKLETAKQDPSNSLTFLTRHNEQVDELKKQVVQKRELLKTAKALIVDLHENFATAKYKFVELKGDPQDKMIFQVQREANLDFVKQLFGLFQDRKVSRLEDELASLTADVEANVGDEEHFDILMESLEECLNVVLPNEMRIDSAGLLKNLMISEDGRMSFAGEDEAEVIMTVAEDTEAEKTRIGGEASEIEEIDADEDGAKKAVAEKAGLSTLVTSTEVVKDAEVHP
ncbi:hypothetical protein AALP_AAs73299U000100 [Arabis alpina]|uniref:Uncharacterized protein n=1 Tax=Arabis alpina TaxID=50452 RepID=A0A087G2R1_ARAAL|nr:hypothetical protein AALP_AAs73299U000100 [Arabis alpina]